MEHVEINKVGVESRQAFLNLIMERLTGKKGTVGISKGIVADTALGNDIKIGPVDGTVLGARGEPLAKDAFGGTSAICVGQVEATESLLEGSIQKT